jgi:hypothetical protein
MASLARRNDAGQGRIVTELHGSSVAFAELSATYPLKLLSPRVVEDGVAIVYVLSYGGGLVGGDCVKLRVDVGLGSRLLLLSQVCPSSEASAFQRAFSRVVGNRARPRSLRPARAAEPRTRVHIPTVRRYMNTQRRAAWKLPSLQEAPSSSCQTP